MTTSLKELLVILATATAVFYFAKPIALQFTDERNFLRRRNVWFALTATAFLSPTFWMFALVATPLLFWAGDKDSNPVALYLLLFHVVPKISVNIPAPGINELFSLDNYRLLSFCVLIPAAWRLRQSKIYSKIHGLTTMDVLLLGYGALQIAIFIPPDIPNNFLLHDSLTNVVRRALLFFVDTYVLYFVVSRSCSSRRDIVEAQATFCLSYALMAPLAAFEGLHHWLLYSDMVTRWSGHALPYFYLYRDGIVRAMVSTGHSLALGYLLAIAFGFWLYLQSQVTSKPSKIIVVLLLWLGLLFAYSRGPWLGALAIYFAFAALRPRALRRLFNALSVALLAAGAVILSPLGSRIISVLPFMGGTVDSQNVIYRQRLAERSWQLFLDHPFLGDRLVLSKMQDLRQGQGIIDLVNAYVGVALFFGLVGLLLFVGFILVGLFKVYRLSRKIKQSDPDLSLLGVSLVACMLGTLFMIANSSLMLGIEKMFYVLAGLAAAFVQLGKSAKSHIPARNPSAPHHINVRHIDDSSFGRIRKRRQSG